jgi:transcriptional regulator with XRE-family HTH domain
VSNEMNRPDLDDVLQWFMASTDRPDWATLQKWMARYPYYAGELSEFAAAWTLSERMPANPQTEALPLEHWTAIGMRAFERAVAEERAQYAASAPPATLLSAAKQQGKSLAHLADETGLSQELVLKLDRRLILGRTIPAELMQRIAAAINAPIDAIVAYLAQPARLATGARYRSEQTPAVRAKESFAAAVTADESLSEADRATLLAMK